MITDPITTHQELAVARLRDQFRAADNDIRKLAEIIGARAQGVEDVIWAVREAIRDVSAQGRSVAGPDETQVRLGKVLGAVPWGGESTDLYETWLTTQIAVNASNGTVEDMLAIQSAGAFGTSVSVLADANDTATSPWGTKSGYMCCIIEAGSRALQIDLQRFNRVLGLLNSGAPTGVRVMLGAWLSDTSTSVFALDSSALDDTAAALYTVWETPAR